MKAVTLCLLSVVLAEVVLGDLQPPERSYKILMLLPKSYKSHRNMFMPLAEALADRGHKIVMLSCLPPATKHPNILEINHGLQQIDASNSNRFEARKELGNALSSIKTTLSAMARDMYKVPAVKELYERRTDFDLIVMTHMFHEFAYPFVHEVPFITVDTPGMDYRLSAVLGNVLNPSYVSNAMMDIPNPMSMWSRIQNTFIHFFVAFIWRNWAVVPAIQEEISAQFPDLPPLLEIERNQSLTLMNTHFSMTTPVPLLPSQVEVGAMHCRPAKPLPQDLEAWIAGAGSTGVIYFSLGSITSGDSMPLQYRQVFVEAFRRLPQRVLWKYEGKLEGLSDNVRVSSWLPQQDVLAHHNVKVFISHGGLFSLQESVYHSTPLLVLPILGDQHRNGMFVENSGLGHMLVWEELTADSIVDALTDITSSPRYKDKVAAMSAALRDQLTTPQERAVFWTEYVIRHRGAPQLRCPAAQLSWVEFLMLDVVGLLLLALLLLLFLMKAVTLCFLGVVLAGQVLGDLQPPERPYKILMLLPMSSKSHRNVFMPLAEALADRGHKIVMMGCLPPAATHPNILEINHELQHVNSSKINMFNFRGQPGKEATKFMTMLPAMARDLYKVPAVKELYERRKDFDLIAIDHIFNEFAYPFVHEVPFITVATPGMDYRQSAVLGNVLNPSYVSSMMVDIPTPMSLWTRVSNTFMHFYFAFIWRIWAVVPTIQKEISAQFPDLPPLLEIERNQSLTLMNTHFSITTPVPLLPSQVEVGAMHCRPAKPLPQDLEAWIAGAGSAGVIYFSLGSIARGETMPPQYRQAFVEAFRRLPQRVLWKYEGELEGLSDNVRISSWLPQQDVLAHHNVKAFISHGGLLSLQESVYHSTPLLVLPIFGDQPRNGMFVENSGLGHLLVWEELTADSIVDALTDITSSPRYKDKVAAMSAALRDQLTTPQERAVFWTEYVIRHRGAPQLRCPAAQLSWVEFLMLDVVGLLLLVVLILLFFVRQLMRAVSAALLGRRGDKKRKSD